MQELGLLLKLTQIIKKIIVAYSRGSLYSLSVFNNCLAFGRWLKENKCDMLFHDRYELYNFVNNDVIRNQPVDFLEFGVYEGNSLLYWATLNQNENSIFFGFDTFSGMPEEWKGFWKNNPVGILDARGKIPATSDTRVRFIKGLFQDTLPVFRKQFASEHRLIVHCDADIYTATLYVLMTLNDLMPAGTIIMFDEFCLVSHEFRAFLDFAASCKRKYKVLAITDNYVQIAIELL